MKLRVVSLFVALIALVMLCVVTALAANGDLLYAHPGRLIDIGGRKINMYCAGSGSPTVVFDSGFEDWAPAWATIQPTVEKWTRACTYDRAGAGFSDPGPLPRTSAHIAEDLHAALHRADVPGPYLLVGHSFGSYNMRMFADKYMNEVAGLVLVDGVDRDLRPQARIAPRSGLFDTGITALLKCGNAVEEARMRPMSTLHPSRFVQSCASQFFRGLPEKKFSATLNAKLFSEVLQSNKQYIASASEGANLDPESETTQALRRDRRSFGNRPVRILTALNHFYDTAATPKKLRAAHAKFELRHRKNQARFLSLSSDSKQLLAPESGHYIQFDDPPLVLSAIHDAINHSRTHAMRIARRFHESE